MDQPEALKKAFARLGAKVCYPSRWAHFPFQCQLLAEEVLSRGSELRVLDVGCGPGWLAAFCQGLHNVLWVGVELWEHQIRQALEKGAYAEIFKVNLIEGLPFAPGSFHVVVCNEVLMYLPDPARILGEFHRVLASNGVLLVYDPISWWPGLKACMKKVARKIYKENESITLDSNGKWHTAKRPSRITFHSSQSLTKCIAHAGFQVEKATGFRIFRNRFSPMKLLENHYLYFRLTTRIAARFPSLATDLLVIARKRC